MTGVPPPGRRNSADVQPSSSPLKCGSTGSPAACRCSASAVGGGSASERPKTRYHIGGVHHKGHKEHKGRRRIDRKAGDHSTTRRIESRKTSVLKLISRPSQT